jgi:hypothetical protein
MISRIRQKQKGATLLVGMVMLVVLTLLVVFAIRSGNTNLKIAGNVQVQTEASAAVQQSIEKIIDEIKLVENFILIDTTDVKYQPSVAGNVNYTVTIEPLDNCKVESPVLNSSLDPANASDVPCFESPDTDKAIKSDGSLTTTLSACKTQQWDIEASVTDANSGAKVTHVQGISIRVPATVDCL